MSFIYILISTLVIAALSLSGILFLTFMKKHMHAGVLALVALSAGAMFGNAFFHLLPEAIELSEEGSIDLFTIMLLIVGSFVASFLFEQFFSWHHCHNTDHCEPTEKPFAHLVLYSDVIHNFIDGLIIAAAFSVSPSLGIATTAAIALHEIPQELGDYAVLIHGGFSKIRAAVYNGLAALTVVLGGIVGYLLAGSVQWTVPVLIPIAIGGFIYISAADLLPELRHSANHGGSRSSIPLHFLIFLTGLAIMIVTAMME
ncbi:MAG: ZIP family metal transporter [Candidatus Uhrbacteria bacterium]|nr:ZIP family metal transporter [Candidatus Uhrbacteria bacterium]